MDKTFLKMQMVLSYRSPKCGLVYKSIIPYRFDQQNNSIAPSSLVDCRVIEIGLLPKVYVIGWLTTPNKKTTQSCTVKPCDSGMPRQPIFFHYCGVFHYFDGQTS